MENSTARVIESKAKAKRITTIGWGLFFIWLGSVLMFNVGMGLVLIGVGTISLGIQIARRYVELESDGFWILVAILFIIVGMWELFDVRLPLMSVLLVVIGVAFLVSALKSGSTGA